MDAGLKDLKLELWLRLRNYGEITWKTREGKEIPIKNMTLTHLINTINMLERIEQEQIELEEAESSFDYEKYYGLL